MRGTKADVLMFDAFSSIISNHLDLIVSKCLKVGAMTITESVIELFLSHLLLTER